MSKGSLWDNWSEKKNYNDEKLERYYHIRNRNFHWLTDLSLSLVKKKKNIRILKTDLWNEAKKKETFFTERKNKKYGIDISNKICMLAKSRYPDLTIVRAGISELPFKISSFDLIWDISTIDHIEHPEKALKGYYNVLSPGGGLLLVVENPFCFSYPVTKFQSFFGHHVPFKTFLPSRILKICRETGFEITNFLKTNIHLPTFIVYPLEKRGLVEKINRNQNIFWQFCKKYFVILARK